MSVDTCQFNKQKPSEALLFPKDAEKTNAGLFLHNEPKDQKPDISSHFDAYTYDIDMPTPCGLLISMLSNRTRPNAVSSQRISQW